MELEKSVSLPLSIITLIDMSRVMRELDNLDEFLIQAAIRKPGTPMSLPRLSRLLDDMATVNKLNLLEEKDRKALVNAMAYVKEHAPRLHISFSAEPSAQFVTKIADYIRKNMSKVALIQVGLQPTIAAGCIIRTPNKQFDLSLRQHLKNNRSKLAELIHQTQVATPNPRPAIVVVGQQPSTGASVQASAAPAPVPVSALTTAPTVVAAPSAPQTVAVVQ